MRLLLALTLLLSAATVHAFDLPKRMHDGEPVRIDKGFFSTKFRQGDDSRLLNPHSIQEVVGRTPEAKSDVTASRVYGYSGLATGAVGGFLFGYSLGATLGGGELNEPMFYSGLGLMAVSIVLSKLSEGKLIKAVEKYNASLPAKVGLDWNLSPERSNLALQLKF
jgi:hypothetical protein